MATDVLENQPEIPDLDFDEPKPKQGLSLGGKKVKVLALLVVVMIVQGALMYLLFPQPAQTNNGERAATADETADGDDVGLDIATAEVSIDRFNSTNSRAEPGSVLNVTFELVAIVSKENEVAFNESANKIHKARVRQAIVEVIRSSSLPDLDDPDLVTIKRLLKEKINKVLRNSYVIEVVISGFRVLIQ